MNFAVNGTEVGTADSELHLDNPSSVQVILKVAANLDPVPDERIRASPYYVQPYWTIERARIGNTREVAVEIVVDGKPVAQKTIVADGQTRDLRFDIPISAAVGLPRAFYRRLTRIQSLSSSGESRCDRCAQARSGVLRRSINAGRKKRPEFLHRSYPRLRTGLRPRP